MSNNEKFDLSGVFQVQQNYLTDLSNSYPNVNNAPLIARYVLDLQDKVNDVTQSYQKADTSADNILTEQNNMIDIVKTEQERIEQKKDLIDDAVMQQKRKALLTESNKLRNAEYTKIILILVVWIVIHILLIAAYKYFFEDPVPSSVFTLFALAHLFNFAIWSIVAFYIYINIQSRSQINFNHLDLPPPTITSTSSAPATEDYSNLFKDLGLCYAEGCCGPNTKWDKQSGECMSDESSNTPQQSPSPESNVEGFQSYNALTTLPEFMPGTKTKFDDAKEEEEVEPYDPLNATSAEIQAKTTKDIQESMDSLFNKVSMTPPQLDFDDVTNNITNSLPNDEILGEEQSFGVKCGFTTMENSLYAPQFKDANPLLPNN